MAYTPWLRPGFELGLAHAGDRRKQNPKAQGIMMGQHGLINWADDDKACYDLHARTASRRPPQYIEAKYAAKGGDAKAFGGAKYQPLDGRQRRAKSSRRSCRGCAARFSQQKRFIGTVQDDDDDPALRQLATTRRAWPSSARAAPTISCAPRSSRSTSTGIRRREDVAALKPKLAAGLDAVPQGLRRLLRNAASTPIRRRCATRTRRSILIPGLGMIAWGKDKSESRVTAEFYNCAVEVMRGAEAIDEYIALPQQEAFDIEYWLLEEAKLQAHAAGEGTGPPDHRRDRRRHRHRQGNRAPPGQGRRAHRLRRLERRARAEATAKEITDKYGVGHRRRRHRHLRLRPGHRPRRATSRTATSMRAMLDQVALAYGGFDRDRRHRRHLRRRRDTTGHIPDDKWALTFAINVTGSYIVADEAARLWKEQGLRGNLVLTTSANAVVAKKG